MIQNVLRDLGGVGMYGVISVCLFFGVFSGSLVWALLLKKPFLREMESLPLVEDTEPSVSLPNGVNAHE